MKDLFSNLVQIYSFLPPIHESSKPFYTPKNDDSNKELESNRCWAHKNTDFKKKNISWLIIVMKSFD